MLIGRPEWTDTLSSITYENLPFCYYDFIMIFDFFKTPPDALKLFPFHPINIPLGTALKVEHARLLCGAGANGSLLLVGT